MTHSDYDMGMRSCPLMARGWWAASVTVAFLIVHSIGEAGFAESAASRPGTAPAGTPVAPSTEQIRQVIGQLNHPVLIRRRAAIRQLAEWGPLVFPELRRAAAGSNLEAALSARDLLAELESAILIGAKVRLSVDRARVAWNEPITLSVHAHNTTTGPLRVPWAAPTTKPAAGVTADAIQVAGMMDAADFLTVIGPDDREIELRVEPIERDPAVYEAVDIRVHTPPTQVIEGGKDARLDILLFNRGWARYPMLAAGKYTISFGYQPRWKDDSWTKAGFGCVRGEPVTVEISPGAPAAIRKAGVALELRIKRSAETLEAELASTWDTLQWINLNVGGPLSTHARIEWQLIPVQDNAEPIDLEPPTGEPRFDGKLLTRIAAGERLVISRVSMAAVRDRLRESAPNATVSFVARVRYTYLSSPNQLRDELTGRGQKVEIPTQLFSGSVSSEEFPLDGAK